MKKKISFIFIFMLILALGMPFSAFAEGENTISLTIGSTTAVVNGANVALNAPPQIINQSTMVPIRFISENMGMTVGWEATTKKITIDERIILFINSKTASVDGKDVTLLTAPTIVNSNTLVPIRFISENLGADVAWDGATKTVTIKQSVIEDVPTILPELEEEEAVETVAAILYQGHGSLRITTEEGKVIYIDPYAGEGYDVPSDLILVTHSHSDHTATSKIKTKNADNQIITYKQALVSGVYKTFDLGFVKVEAVQAGNNSNHDIKECVGFILTLSDGTTIYVSGDTSKTDQMATFAERNLDYAFFCCDGIYNMGMTEAIECAKLVGAKNSIPYHMAPGKNFDRTIANKFIVDDRLIVADNVEMLLTKASK